MKGRDAISETEQDKTIKLKYIFSMLFPIVFFYEIHKAFNYYISRCISWRHRKYLPYISSIKNCIKKEKIYIKHRVRRMTEIHEKEHENAEIEKSNFLSVGPLYSNPDQGSRRRLNTTRSTGSDNRMHLCFPVIGELHCYCRASLERLENGDVEIGARILAIYDRSQRGVNVVVAFYRIVIRRDKLTEQL